MPGQATASRLIFAFVIACAAMHIIQPELSPVDDAVSFYMNGRFGWLLGAALVALGVGSLLALRHCMRTLGLTARNPGVILLGAWGVGCVVGGIFPPDPRGHWNEPPSFAGAMHNAAAMVAFLSFPAAALLLSGPRPPLRMLARLSVAATVLFFACLAPAMVAHQPPVALGLTERLVLAINVAWLLTALRTQAAVTSWCRTDGARSVPRS